MPQAGREPELLSSASSTWARWFGSAPPPTVGEAWGKVRGQEVRGRISRSTRNLAKELVKACQNDGTYPHFADDAWAPVMKAHTDGDITIRPWKIQKLDEVNPAKRARSESPVLQTPTREEMLGQPAPWDEPILPAWQADDASQDAAGVVAEAEWQNAPTTPPSASAPNAEQAIETPDYAKGWSPDSKFLLKATF